MTFDPAGPPIIPGPAEPYTLANVMPAPFAPAAAKHRGRPWFIGGLAVLLVLTATGTYVWLFGKTEIRAAYEACGQVGQLADDDTTLILDTKGSGYNSGTVSVEDLKCYLTELKVPTFVISKMETTRALDGRVSETWDGFEASWTYHPTNGLDVLIREV